MTTLFFFVVGINAISVLYLLVTLTRLRNYVTRNCFEESKYTLLFGFVPLQAYVYGYVIMVIAYGMFLWYIVL